MHAVRLNLKKEKAIINNYASKILKSAYKILKKVKNTKSIKESRSYSKSISTKDFEKYNMSNNFVARNFE
jgi:hypothetical protein